MWEKAKDSIWCHRRAAGPLSALALVSMLAIAAHDIKPASAQDWPTHPLTMVVPFASGGGTDVMARIVGRRMSEILGQEVIVQNKPGAGRMVGSAYVARATPDGYTLVFGSRSAAIDMTLYKHPTYSLQNWSSP
jgi:tripartite-type tricarboxylate transporter receptor subunit TctC